MWEYQIPSLMSSDIRFIVYDQRGCGRSDHASHGYQFDTLADDLAMLIERLDLNDLTLAGWSLGGGVVARYLARHGSARVARSILISTNTPFLLKGDNNPEGLDRSLIYDPFIAGLLDDRPQFLTKVAPLFFGAPVSPEIIWWGIGYLIPRQQWECSSFSRPYMRPISGLTWLRSRCRPSSSMEAQTRSNHLKQLANVATGQYPAAGLKSTRARLMVSFSRTGKG